MSNDEARVDALLFDLGGVLVEFDWQRAFAYWGDRGATPAERLRERFVMDAAFERYERGETTAAEHFAALRATLGADLSHDDLYEGWNRIFIGAIEPTMALIGRLDPHMPLYVFSNTNAAHHSAWARDYAAALAPFRRVFTSFEIGRRKPERAAYEIVAREIGVPIGRVLFLDDVIENVRGARAAGMQAAHVPTPADVARVLAPWVRG